MLEQDDISTEVVVAVHWRPLVFPKFDLCKCGNFLGAGDVCPASKEILGADGELCNCCDDCRNKCQWEI